MYRQQVKYIVGLLMVSDAAAMLVAAWLARLAAHGLGLPSHPLLVPALLLAMINNFALLKLGLYSDRRPTSFKTTCIRIVWGAAISFAVLILAFFALHLSLPPRGIMALYLILVTALLAANRAVLEVYLERQTRTDYGSRRVLVVGSGRRADLVCKAVSAQRSWGHILVGYLLPEAASARNIYGLPCLGELADLEKILMEQAVDETFFVLPRDFTGDIKPAFGICEDMGVAYRIVPVLFDPTDSVPIKVESIQSVPTLFRDPLPINPSGHLYKKALDMVGGLAGSLILLAVLPFAALAIKLDSPGPVFFRQKRVGRNGRSFIMYKFRTMRVDAEAMKPGLMAENKINGAMFKLDRDPRVTRVGRFLRRTSLDELPQFINVLQGRMSLVGTRPPTPDEVKKYSPRHRRRLSMAPGITGLWQISGRSAITDFDDIVALDLKYIDRWRFLHDLEILTRTLWVVIRGRGAE